MDLKFSIPARSTRVRFFPSEAAFSKAFVKRKGLCLWDEGAPISTDTKRVGIHFLPGGESCKRWSEAGKILEMLASMHQERSQALLVVGGGALLDLGALVASLYRRGTPLVMVPTTLLGMVDASVGGKTAVDSATGSGLLKNFAGTFYPAGEVWIAPHFLASLTRAERISGAGECWKTLWIEGISGKDGALFEFILSGKVSAGLRGILRKCLAAKIRVVQKDPLDTKRIREILNFGHTVGHALESGEGISHGEAVLWGMAVESTLLGKKGETMQKEILRVLLELKLNIPPAFFAEKDYGAFLLGDKKAKGGKIELSLLAKPGKIEKLRIAPAKIAAAIKAFPEFYRRASSRLLM